MVAKVESKVESMALGGPGVGGPTSKIIRGKIFGPQDFFRVRLDRTGATVEHVRPSKMDFGYNLSRILLLRKGYLATPRSY